MASASSSWRSLALIAWASWFPGWLCVLHNLSQCVVRELVQIFPTGLQVALFSQLYSLLCISQETPLRFPQSKRILEILVLAPCPVQGPAHSGGPNIGGLIFKVTRLWRCLHSHSIRKTGCSTAEVTVGTVLAAITLRLADGPASVQQGTEKAPKCLPLLWRGGGLTVRALPADFAIFLKTFQFKSQNPLWKKKVPFPVISCCAVAAHSGALPHLPVHRVPAWPARWLGQ